MSQRRMGPAPFASFEDLSDEVRHGVESPTAVRLPDIRECAANAAAAKRQPSSPPPPTAATLSCLQTPSTPRIDISRASSSSQHEEDNSRDSTPERELFGPQCARLGVAFTEDGAMDLRSSTEELDFQEPRPGAGRASDTATQHSHSSQQQQSSQHARKDSQGSELGLLSVSGRTSRLSSVGSQGSRASAQSHASGLSRSPSPHKMLLETSFCGGKPNSASAAAAAKPLEQALLARRQDPTEAVLAEGISIEMRKKIQPIVPPEPGGGSPKRRQPPPPVPQPTTVTTRVQQPPSSIPIVVETDTGKEVLKHPLSPGKTIVADSGVEYTFIPLKGPLPPHLANRPVAANSSITRNKIPPSAARRPQKTPPKNDAGKPSSKTAPKPTTQRPSLPRTVTSPKPTPGSPEYIRIRLKPDHMYTDVETSRTNSQVTTQANTSPEVHNKPATLNLNSAAPPAAAVTPVAQPRAATGSPKLPRLRDTALSRTPSPSVSRKSSFTSLFRSKEAVVSSPESPAGERVRSKSKEREHKGSVFGIFKPKRSCIKKQTSPEVVHVTSPLPSLEFTFNSRPPNMERLKYYETPLEGDSIRIPLHSPGTEPEPLDLLPGSPPPEQKPAAASPAQQPQPPTNARHSSTSSETMIFTTNLGSDNEVFTTKLPREKTQHITENHCERPVERRLSAAEPTPPPAEPAQVTTPPPSPEPPDENLSSVRELTRSASSESEREVPELALVAAERQADEARTEDDEHELKTLVFQQDSFEDDELPYVPTTLPLERSVAVPMVPVKQRGEVRMCPIERPRSTTPINPNCLEDYCDDGIKTAEPKLRISLPRDDPAAARGRPTRRWTDFAECEMGGGSSPPPLPPRGAPRDWINFEEVPERRKPPKRIQILPSGGGRAAASAAPEETVVYSYVNPEDCKCECHELGPRAPQPQEADERAAATANNAASSAAAALPTPDAFPDHHHKVSS